MIKATAEDVGGDFGFDPTRVLTAGISLTNARYHAPACQTAFFQSVIEKLRGAPGIEAATVADALRFNAGRLTFSIQGQPVLAAAERPKARCFAVGSDYFRVLRIPLIQGRTFRETDNASAPAVAMTNRVFAKRFFAAQNPIGRRISIDRGELGEPVWREIIGIAGDIKAPYGSPRKMRMRKCMSRICRFPRERC
jgi:putative ABC transport system permease protein